MNSKTSLIFIYQKLKESSPRLKILSVSIYLGQVQAAERVHDATEDSAQEARRPASQGAVKVGSAPGPQRGCPRNGTGWLSARRGQAASCNSIRVLDSNAELAVAYAELC